MDKEENSGRGMWPIARVGYRGGGEPSRWPSPEYFKFCLL